jgi:ATP-binding cassette subfamily F protein 3
MYPEVKDQQVRNHLGALGCKGDLALQKIGKLSGGQKSRVAFALLTYKEPHLLVMDEPTNHLDIESIEALILAVQRFKGGLLCVSHDQYFLANVVNEYWSVANGGGEVKAFEDIDDAKMHAYNIVSTQSDKKKAGPGGKKAKKKKGKQYDSDDDDDDKGKAK